MYFIFGGIDIYYPSGGANDFICAKQTLDAAQLYVQENEPKLSLAWAHIAVFVNDSFVIVANWIYETIYKNKKGECDTALGDGVMEKIQWRPYCGVWKDGDERFSHWFWEIDGKYYLPVESNV